MDPKIIDHQFVVAAYVATWGIQLFYLAFLGLKWRSQKRAVARSETRSGTNAGQRRK
jgi:hypothetical protein